MSYDNFHPKAERIYRVHTALFKWEKYGTNASEIQEGTTYPLANYLKSNFPEIESACGIRSASFDKFSFLYADSFFCNIFDVNLPEDFFVKGNADRPAAVTNGLKGAAEYIKEQFDYDVRAIIPDWPTNTNIPFNTVIPLTVRYTEEDLSNWDLRICDTYILIKSGADIQALEKKLNKVTLPHWPTPVSLVLTPLKQLRYKDPSGNIQSDIKFSHIRIFAVAGLLVILCSLFNHLTLYVSRVRMRLRELTLHKVNGATDWQIAATLYTDFLLAVLLSLGIGLLLMICLLPTFKEYATIGNNNTGIYVELLGYAALLIVCGFALGGIPVFYFRKKTLSDSIKSSNSAGSQNLFFKGCLLVQLIISLGLMFCSVVFIKQLYYLNHTDLGINRRNIAAVSAECCPLTPPYAERIRQIPGITDVLPITGNYFLEDMSIGSETQGYEKDGEKLTYTLLTIIADAHFFDFFGVEIIEGTGFSNEYNYKRVLNEAAVRAMGDNIPKSITSSTGVARDFYLTPTTKAKPTGIWYPDPKYNFFKAIAYRYEENRRSQTQEAITRWMREEFPDAGEFGITFTYMEDVFEEYFKSERALLSLLSVMTGACILIAVFGVYSLTNLRCQQRRKEVAMRKINGAEVSDILNIFFNESLSLLIMAALAAFPAGYIIMKRWLEGYAKQTSMDAWVFILIFVAVFVVIVLSIASMVWKAANRNPIEAVKME